MNWPSPSFRQTEGQIPLIPQGNLRFARRSNAGGVHRVLIGLQRRAARHSCSGVEDLPATPPFAHTTRQDRAATRCRFPNRRSAVPTDAAPWRQSGAAPWWIPPSRESRREDRTKARRPATERRDNAPVPCAAPSRLPSFAASASVRCSVATPLRLFGQHPLAFRDARCCSAWVRARSAACARLLGKMRLVRRGKNAGRQEGTSPGRRQSKPTIGVERTCESGTRRLSPFARTGQPLPVAANVFRHLLDRRIAPGRLFAKRREDNRVEFSTQLLRVSPRHLTHGGRIVLADRAHHFVRQRALPPERMLAGQHLIKQNAKRERRPRGRNWLPANLFGTGVFGRQNGRRGLEASS